MWPARASSSSTRALALGVLLGFGACVPLHAQTPAPWKSPKAHEQFDEGRKLQDQALYPLAIDQFQMSLDGESRPETERAIAECFAAVDQHLLAATHFERYVAKEPKDAEAWNRLGCLWIKVNKLDEAAAAFRRLQPLDPESAKTGLFSVELKLGENAFKKLEFRKAADHFLAAEKVGGTDERALDGISKALRALGESQLPKQGLAALNTASELYEHGLTTGLRSLLERAYAAAGRPAKLQKRVKKMLDDPRLK